MNRHINPLQALTSMALVLALTLTPTFAIDNRAYEAAVSLLETVTTDAEASCQLELPYQEATPLFRDLRYVLFGLTSGYSPKSHARISRQGNVSNVKLTLFMDPAEDLILLRNDPRIILEIQKLQALETFEEKVFEVYWFTRNAAEYDYEFVDDPSHANSDSTTALGCLNGRAICQGYSNLANHLFDAIEIENVKVYCRITKPDGVFAHIFNVVRSADGALYAVDATTKTENPLCMLDLDTYAKKTHATFMVDAAELFGIKYPLAETDVASPDALTEDTVMDGAF